VNHAAWAAAFAFVGLCAAFAYGTVYAPPTKTVQVVCIEQRGKWVWESTWHQRGTCEFPCGESK
jgi:hypothetical protein